MGQIFLECLKSIHIIEILRGFVPKKEGCLTLDLLFFNLVDYG